MRIFDRMEDMRRFISGVIASFTAFNLESKPLSYFSVIIGIFVLIDLAFSITMNSISPFNVLVEEELKGWHHILY